MARRGVYSNARAGIAKHGQCLQGRVAFGDHARTALSHVTTLALNVCFDVQVSGREWGDEGSHQRAQRRGGFEGFAHAEAREGGNEPTESGAPLRPAFIKVSFISIAR